MAEQEDILDSNLIQKERQLFLECKKWVLYSLLALLIILVPTVPFLLFAWHIVWCCCKNNDKKTAIQVVNLESWIVDQ